MFSSLRNKIFFVNMLIFISLMTVMTSVIINLFQEEKKKYIYDLNISSAIHIADGIKADLLTVAKDADSISQAAIRDKILARIERSEGFEVMIVDKKGRLFAHQNPKEIAKNSDMSNHPIVAAFIKGNVYAGTGEFKEESGRIIIGAYSMIEGTDLGVIVQRPYEMISKVFKNAKFRIIYIVLLLIIAAFIFFALFAKRLIQPLERLTDWAGKIKGGDYHTKADIKTGDEIGRLAETLEDMTSELLRREENLKNMYDKLISAETEATGYLAGHKIHESLNLDDVMTVTTRLAREQTDAEAGLLLQYDSVTNKLNKCIADNIAEETISDIEIEGWGNDAKGEELIINTLKKRVKVNSYIVCALQTINTVHGVLIVINNRDGKFLEHHKNIILIFASQAAVSFEKIKLFQRSEYLATHDPLTGVLNRNFFNRIEYNKTDNIKPQCYMLIDIDYFKKINDTYGHPTGDTILKEIGGVLRKHARDKDMVVRYGGEEFLVVISDSDKSSGAAFAERIRGIIEKTDFFIDNKRSIHITVSIGVCAMSDIAEMERKNMKACSLVEAADIALYRAKETGRNRVEVFSV